MGIKLATSTIPESETDILNNGNEKKQNSAAEGAAPVVDVDIADQENIDLTSGNGTLYSEKDNQFDNPEKFKNKFLKDVEYFEDLKDKKDKYISRRGGVEEILKEDLNDKFSKWGFIFDSVGLGDYIEVSTTDPDNVEKETFSVGSGGKYDYEGLEELKAFIINKRQQIDVFLEETPTLTKQDLYEMKSREDLNPLDPSQDIKAESNKNKDLNNFASKYYASKGLNWGAYKQLDKDQKFNQAELDFIEKNILIPKTAEERTQRGDFNSVADLFVSAAADNNNFIEDFKATPLALQKYPNLFNEDGTLAGDKDFYKEVQEYLSDKNSNIANILTNPEFAEVKDDFLKVLNGVKDDAQVEFVGKNKYLQQQNEFLIADWEKKNKTPWADRVAFYDAAAEKNNNIEQQVIKITGKGFSEIQDYKPKTQEESDKLNELIAQSNAIIKELLPSNGILATLQKNQAAQKRLNTLANNTLLISNFDDMVTYRGEYVEDATDGIYNEFVKGASEGRVNKEFLKIAYNIDDAADPDQLANASKRIALEKANSAGILSTRVYERYQNASSVAEQMALLQQDPTELLLSMAGSSLSMFWNTGNELFIPIVVGSGVAGGIIGSTGFVTGPGGILTTGGGIVSGLTKGLEAWSTITGYAMEVGSAYSTVMVEAGVDMRDEDQLLAFLKNKELMAKAQKLGEDRGLAVSLMNLVGTRLAGAVINPLDNAITTVGKSVVLQGVVDPATDMGGEALAQVYSGQEFSAIETINEGLGMAPGKMSSISKGITQNVIMDGQTNMANKLLDIKNMVAGNHSVNEIRAFTNQLLKKNKITQVQAQTLIKNAEINSQVNNALENSNKSLMTQGKEKIIGDGGVKQRLAALMKEKDLFKGKAIESDLQNEIDVLLETNQLASNPIELTSDYQERISKEIGMVNKVLKGLGVKEDLGMVDVDDIESIQNNPELLNVLEQLLEDENKRRDNTGEPKLENVQEYLEDSFKIEQVYNKDNPSQPLARFSTHRITPKGYGKQFTLYSGTNMMAQMTADRNNENRSGAKGFRHETLHFILDQVMDSKEVNEIATKLEAYMEEESSKDGGAVSAGTWNTIKKRLDGYKQKLEDGTYDQSDYDQEVFTVLSDAINDEDLKLERQNKSFWLRIADDLKDFYKYTVGMGREEIDAQNLDSAEAAFEFIKNYNKAFLGKPKRFKKIKNTGKSSNTGVRDSKTESTTTKVFKDDLGPINSLMPETVNTREDYFALLDDPSVTQRILSPTGKLAPQILNYITKRTEGNPTLREKIIESVRDRLINFNPEAKRADGSIIGAKGFGEFIFANTNFGRMDAKKKLAKASEKQKSEIGLTDKEGKPLNIAADDNVSTRVEDKKDRVTPKSKISKEFPEVIDQDLKDEIETAGIEIFESETPDISDTDFKGFLTEVFRGKLTKSVKKKLGTGKMYEFVVKKMGPKLKDLLPIQWFVRLEGQTKPDNRLFTKPPKRLTKKEDVDAALLREDVYVENLEQGVNLYEFKDFKPKELIDYILAPAVSPTTGAKSGLRGNRKTTFTEGLVDRLGRDATPSSAKRTGRTDKEVAAISKKMQVDPRMRMSFDDQSNWNKIVESKVGLEPIKMNTLKGKEQFINIMFLGDDKLGVSPMASELPKSFIINNIGTFSNGGKNDRVDNETFTRKGKKIDKRKYYLKDGSTVLNSDKNFESKEIQLQIQPVGNFAFANKTQVLDAVERLEKLAKEKNVDAFASEDSKVAKALKRQSYKTLEKEMNKPDFASNQKESQQGFKSILSVFDEIIKSDRRYAPAVVALMSSTSGGQNHFIRKGSLTNFINTLNTANVEEHVSPASDFAKFIVNRMLDGTYKEYVDKALDSYFQGSLPRVFDHMLKGEGFNYIKSIPAEYKDSVLAGLIPVWVRYFNPNVNKQRRYDKGTNKEYTGIDPNVIILANGNSIAKEYNLEVDKDQLNPDVIAEQQRLLFEIFTNPQMTKAKARKQLNATLKANIKKNKTNQKINIPLLKDSKVMNTRSSETMTTEEVLSKALSIDDALRNARKPNAPVKKIRVFDFDDTVGTSKNKVFANKGDESKVLNAEEFAKEGLELIENGWSMDFSDFNEVTEGGKGPLFDVMKTMSEAEGKRDIFILTARAPEAAPAIHMFLKEMGIDIPLKNITGLGNSTGEAKANWIIDKAADGYNDFYFADDAYQNVKAVKQVMSVVDVKSKVQQAKIKMSEDMSMDFNVILEQSTGMDRFATYSDVKAKVAGARKGRFKFYIPPSAEDFEGLLYTTLGKGEEGRRHMQFYDKTLLKPYAQAMENLSTDRVNLMSDFKELKKVMEVPANLKKTTKSGFSNEQAVRVYLFDKTGQEIPGLSKTDFEELMKIVESDGELKAFADQILTLTKGDGYAIAKENWAVGTITTDLIDLLNSTKRDKYLQNWKENVDIIFSKENMNKLEALYGPKYVGALKSSLERMKAGKNRIEGGNRLSNQVLDYINNSTAVTMFFNTRSALLQTISAANFINWSFNSPLQAGIAFANQVQYWKDFSMIINSDYLVDRRNGLKLNISESEIADAAKTSKNKARAALNYLLEKGYAPTKYADSFAIASGGALFYRNRVNDLIKQGISEKDAKTQAMQEFREKSEKSQQSSDPSKISEQQSGDLGRIILQYVNTPMQYARMQKRDIQDMLNRRPMPGKTLAQSNRTRLSRIAYYAFIQNLMFNALQQSLYVLGFGDDEDELDEKQKAAVEKDKNKRYFNTVNGMLDSQLRGLGLGGVTIQVLKNLGINIYERSQKDRPEYSDAWIKLLEFSPSIKRKLMNFKSAGYPFDTKKRRQEVFEKGFNLDNPAYEAAAKVVSATTNVPVDRLFSKVENLKHAFDEETEMWQSIAMVLGWRKWQLEVKKPDAEITPEEKSKAKVDLSLERYKEAKGSTDYDIIKKLTSPQQIKMLKGLGYGDYTIKNAKSEKAKIDLIIYKNKGGKIKIDKKAVDTAKYKALSKADQVRKLDSLGLNKADIAKLKYEKDRVAKLLELMKN